MRQNEQKNVSKFHLSGSVAYTGTWLEYRLAFSSAAVAIVHTATASRCSHHVSLMFDVYTAAYNERCREPLAAAGICGNVFFIIGKYRFAFRHATA